MIDSWTAVGDPPPIDEVRPRCCPCCGAIAIRAGKLQPVSRRRGIALALDDPQRQTLLAIRRAHPSAAAELILCEAVRHGVVAQGQISVSTLRRLFRDHDLPRSSVHRASRRALRRKWAAARVGQVWHADVCHVAVRTPAGTRHSYRVHALLDDHSRFLVALEVRETETERDLLEVLCTALLLNPASPSAAGGPEGGGSRLIAWRAMHRHHAGSPARSHSGAQRSRLTHVARHARAGPEASAKGRG